jgi:hypothetical protein
MKTCIFCYNDHNEEGEYCKQCTIDHKRGYQVVSKTGRRANGSELDHGILFHVVPLNSYTAICGTKPGKHADWSTWKPSDIVTCPKCQKKLEKWIKENN